MTSKKCLFFTNYFYPETFRGNDIAFDLARRGYDVTVLCNIPNYPKGKFFDGYSLFTNRCQTIHGVKVIRVPIIPRGKGGKARMALNYISGLLCMYCYAFHFGVWHKFDFVFVQQLSPVFIGLPALLYKRMRNVPIIYWLLDLWPDSLVAGGISNPKIIEPVRRTVNHIYRGCDKILVSSKGFCKSVSAAGITADKIEYFPNWSENAERVASDIQIPQLPDGFKIMFAGNLGEAQNLENVMRTALAVSNRKDIQWIMVGDGRKRDWCQTFINENSLSDTVHLMGHFPMEAMPDFFARADIMLVSLCNEPAFVATLPAKMQAYMAAGKPVLAMLNGEGRTVLNDAQCGFGADADDVSGMAQLVLKVADMPHEKLAALGLNGKEYYNQHFSKVSCMEHLQKILSENV